MTTSQTTPIVFVDTETDGVHPDRGVWEVAFIRRDQHGERRREFFIDIDLSDADPFGLKVGGFYDRHPLGRHLSRGEPFRRPSEHGDYLHVETAARAVAQWTHGAHLVGVNPAFDAETLDGLLRDCDLLPAWDYHLIDVSAMALGYLQHTANHMLARAEVEQPPADAPWMNLRAEGERLRQIATPPYRSDELGEALGVKPLPEEKRHTAMGDAEWAMAMYDRMTGVAS